MSDTQRQGAFESGARWTVADLPDEERLAALDHIESLVRAGERDAALLDARTHDPAPYEEAYRLIELLRGHAHA